MALAQATGREPGSTKPSPNTQGQTFNEVLARMSVYCCDTVLESRESPTSQAIMFCCKLEPFSNVDRHQILVLYIACL